MLGSGSENGGFKQRKWQKLWCTGIIENIENMVHFGIYTESEMRRQCIVSNKKRENCVSMLNITPVIYRVKLCYII